jgi:TolA-binding protein
VTRFSALAVVLLLPACAATKSDVAPLEAAAERAYGAGRYDEAAANWNDAARTTKSAREREEALYREAVTLVRAGLVKDAEAVYATLLREFPSGDRAPRAAFDRATLVIEQGDVEDGHEELDGALRKYPNGGTSRAALSEMVRFHEAESENAVREYLTALDATLGATELGPFIHYAIAESFERSADLGSARARYLLVAERYPYPADPLWDDALWHVADLDAKLGDPHAAIEHLERMLREREPSYIEGSYERGRYAEAKFRIAELYRDALKDPEKARTTFEALFREHPDSRLRDDAAWNAARLARSAGDEEGACRDLRALIQAIPTSRYVACAPQLCPRVGETPGACHEYLTERADP